MAKLFARIFKNLTFISFSKANLHLADIVVQSTDLEIMVNLAAMRYVNPHGRRAVLWWLYIGMCMTFVMVAIGGATRLTDSGLSITEWEVVKGSLPPLTEAAWQQAFEKYQRIPQYLHQNPDMDLEGFKSIYWWEWIHRFWGRLIGLVFIVPFLYFIKKKYLRPPMYGPMVILFLLGALQGFLGWFMVQSCLEGSDLTSVSHYRLAIHLSMAFITISYLFWLTLNIRFEAVPPSQNKYPAFRTHVKVFLALLAVQIIYGAFTAGLDAGHASAHWPMWNDHEWTPSGFKALQVLWTEPAWIQFFHRSFAYVVVVYAFWMLWSSRKLILRPQQRKALRWVGGAILAQFALGVFTVVGAVPLSVALLHQFGALVLLLAALFLLHQLSPNAESSR